MTVLLWAWRNENRLLVLFLKSYPWMFDISWETEGELLVEWLEEESEEMDMEVSTAL